MGFVSLLVVLALVQWWGSGGPLQRDAWYLGLIQRVHHLVSGPVVRLFLLVGVPVFLLLALCLALVYGLSSKWIIVINVPILLFSLGRGRLDLLVQNYRTAWLDQANQDACEAVNALRLDGELSCQTDGQWQGVHAEAFQAISYRGFERMFVVLFWFAILGAPGALLYRLAAIYGRQATDADVFLVRRLVWILEWPAARVYYLSVAMVGNFVACAERWRVLGLCMASPTPMVVEAFNRGALGLDGALVREISPAATEALREIDNLVGLMSRALILWVCAAALIALLLGG